MGTRTSLLAAAVIAASPGAAAASPLTRAPGRKSHPRFSPDGQTVAFSGNYDGNDDLYTLSVSGGPIQRVTHRGSASLIDWTPDGRLLYASNGFSFSWRVNEL